MLGVVQTADGMPIYHEVFNGNTAEAPTLKPTLAKVLARYPHIRRLVVVADRGFALSRVLDKLGGVFSTLAPLVHEHATPAMAATLLILFFWWYWRDNRQSGAEEAVSS